MAELNFMYGRVVSFRLIIFFVLKICSVMSSYVMQQFSKKNLNESFFGINSMNNKNDFISLVIVMHINIHFKSHTASTQVTNKTHGPLIK